MTMMMMLMVPSRQEKTSNENSHQKIYPPPHTIVKISDYLGPDIAVVSDQIIKVDTTALHNEVRKMRIDEVPPPPAFDDLRNYAFEGSGSTAGSLSSVLDTSGTRLK